MVHTMVDHGLITITYLHGGTTSMPIYIEGRATDRTSSGKLRRRRMPAPYTNIHIHSSETLATNCSVCFSQLDWSFHPSFQYSLTTSFLFLRSHSWLLSQLFFAVITAGRRSDLWSLHSSPSMNARRLSRMSYYDRSVNNISYVRRSFSPQLQYRALL